MARVTDFEWARQCERVRRSACLIGEVAQWRAYCEAEWTGGIPGNLKDIIGSDKSITTETSSSREESGETNLASGDGYARNRSPARSPIQTDPQEQQKRRISPLQSPSSQQPSLSSGPPSTTDLQEKPRSEFDPSTIGSFDSPGFNTLTASFPAPPSSLPSNSNTPERGSKLRKSSLVAMNITTANAAYVNSPISNNNQENFVSSEKTESPSNGSAGKGSRVAAMRDMYDKGVSIFDLSFFHPYQNRSSLFLRHHLPHLYEKRWMKRIRSQWFLGGLA
jgi:hypothetical protein